MTGERKPKMSIDEIKAAVLHLPVEERAELVGYLQDTLSETETDAAWRAEVRHRMDLIDAGEMEWLDEDQVLAELDAEPGFELHPEVLTRARRTMADIKSGRAQAIPAAEVIEMLDWMADS